VEDRTGHVRGIPEPLDLEERLANLASDQVVPGGAWAMFLNPEGRDRQSIRLKGYDYSRVGAYFVTICTQGRACLFGEVVGGAMRMSAAGQMTLSEWEALPTRFPTIELGAFVVMPNHVHGIIVITPDRVGPTGLRPSALPHHRTCGFPHPAVEPSGLSPRASTVASVRNGSGWRSSALG
jgi:hypothetical protein